MRKTVLHLRSKQRVGQGLICILRPKEMSVLMFGHTCKSTIVKLMSLKHMINCLFSFRIEISPSQRFYHVKTSPAQQNLPLSSSSTYSVKEQLEGVNLSVCCAVYRLKSSFYEKCFSLKDKNYKAAKSLGILSTKGSIIFVADVYIYKSCYASFVNKPVNLGMLEEHL